MQVLLPYNKIVETWTYNYGENLQHALMKLVIEKYKYGRIACYLNFVECQYAINSIISLQF